MVALAAADERGAEIEMLRPAGLGGGEDAGEELFQGGRGKRRDGLVHVRMMLHAQARVEQAQVLRDLGDSSDGGLARAARDALLDGDGGRDAGEAVHGGAG